MPSNKHPELKIRNLQFDENDGNRVTRLTICPRTIRISKQTSRNRKEVQNIYCWKREAQSSHSYSEQYRRYAHHTDIK